MPFELSDWSLSEIRPHPFLAGRILAQASVTLREQAQHHRITLKVWADVAPGSSDADIEYALYRKAAELARRTMLAADLSNYRMAAE